MRKRKDGVKKLPTPLKPREGYLSQRLPNPLSEHTAPNAVCKKKKQGAPPQRRLYNAPYHAQEKGH